jgi:flagellar protein FlaG
MEGDALSLGRIGGHAVGLEATAGGGLLREASKSAPAAALAEVSAHEKSREPFPSKESTRAAAQEFGEALARLNHGIRFEIDETTETVVVKIVDRNTDEVLRQIPPKELLELSQRFRRYVGVLLDTEG